MIAWVKQLRPSWSTLFLSGFFFLLPWQTRYIVGFDSEEAISQFMVLSVYATELLLIGGAAVQWLRPNSRPHIAKEYRRAGGLVLAVVAYVALSIMWADYRALAAFQTLHVGCAALVCILLLDKKVDLRVVGLAFVLGLLPPIALGLWQVVFESSGASSFLGLAARDAETLGDAVTVHDGVRELRAYGSFPHPNIFGGYLAVGIVTLGWLFPTLPTKKWCTHGIALLLILALVLTASRSALFGIMLGCFLAGAALRVTHTELVKKLLVPAAALVIAGVLSATYIAPELIAHLRGGGALETRAIDERHAQYGEWLGVLQGGQDWVFGHGVGQYVRELMGTFAAPVWSYQPVHNVPLLLVAELGVIGLSIIVYTLMRIMRTNVSQIPSRHAAIAFAMGTILFVIVFFDHYLWTSWAGLVLVAYIAAYTVRLGDEP